MRRLILSVAVGFAIGTPLATVKLVEGALHMPDRPQPSAAQADAFARETESTWQTATTIAADGARLEAWLFTPRDPNGALVLLLHGVDDSRRGMVAHARYLLRDGFTVLIPDSRGHGASGGDIVTYGLREAGDVSAWLDSTAARPRDRAQRIYGLGESMGAAVLIQSLPRERRFRAIVAECPFASFEDVSYDRLRQVIGLGRPALWPVLNLGFLYTRARYHIDLRRASPADALRASDTPTLLIHGTADSNIPFHHSERLHAVNPAATTLWPVPGAEHVSAISVDPERYARTVTRWFNAH